MVLFWKGKTRIIAKFLRTDLVICNHSREGKNLSCSRINMVPFHLLLVQVSSVLATFQCQVKMIRAIPDKLSRICFQERNYISILASILILLFVNYNVYLCCHTYSRNKICLNHIIKRGEDGTISGYTQYKGLLKFFHSQKNNSSQSKMRVYIATALGSEPKYLPYLFGYKTGFSSLYIMTTNN